VSKGEIKASTLNIHLWKTKRLRGGAGKAGGGVMKRWISQDEREKRHTTRILGHSQKGRGEVGGRAVLSKGRETRVKA